MDSSPLLATNNLALTDETPTNESDLLRSTTKVDVAAKLSDYDMSNLRYLYALQMRETEELQFSIALQWRPSQRAPEFLSWYTWFAGTDVTTNCEIPLLVVNNATSCYMNDLALVNYARGAQQSINIRAYPLPGKRLVLKHIVQTTD